VRRLVSALVGGLVLSRAFPAPGWWWLAPVAVAVLALVTRDSGARRGAAAGFAFGLGFFLPTLQWAATDFLGIIPWLGLSTLQSLYAALLGAVCGWLQQGQVRPLVVALAWLGQEALRDRTPYGGFPWVRLAHSQADAPTAHLAALAGIPAVTFATALAGGLLAAGGWAAYRSWRESQPTGRRVAMPLAGALVVLGVGALVPLPTDGRSVDVLAVQGNVPTAGLDFNAQRRAVLDNHVTGTIRAAERGRADGLPAPDLVAWPENASDIDPLLNPDAAAQIAAAGDAAQAPVLLGAVLEQPAPKVSNATMLYRPGEGFVQTYVKRHPAPFAEYIPNRELFRLFSGAVDLLQREMASGSTPGVFRVPARSGGEVVIGATICFEVAYDDLVRDTVVGGATLLLVQTNNATFGYTSESVQQLSISRLRAIEHGRSVVHVSTVGVSALILPDGTLLQPTSLYTAATLRAALPMRSASTLATTLGPWPEYLGMLTLTLLVLMRAGRLRDRPRKD